MTPPYAADKGALLSIIECPYAASFAVLQTLRPQWPIRFCRSTLISSFPVDEPNTAAVIDL